MRFIDAKRVLVDARSSIISDTVTLRRRRRVRGSNGSMLEVRISGSPTFAFRVIDVIGRSEIRVQRSRMQSVFEARDDDWLAKPILRGSRSS